MLVQNSVLNFSRKIQPYQISPTSSYVSFRSNNVDSVDKVELGNISALQSGLAKLDKITKEEYESLTENEKIAIRKASTEVPMSRVFSDYGLLGEYVQKHFFTAEAIKTVMNAQFGEGNYVLVPIGRSLSSICKLVGLQIGEENVKNIPMTKVGRYFTHKENLEIWDRKLDSFLERPGIEEFKKSLSRMGLDKEAIESSGKHYILLDYCYTGDSLNAAYDILTSDEMLGNNKKNIHQIPVNLIFQFVKFNFSNYFEMIHSLMTDFEFSNYKPYSTVGKLEGPLDYISDAFDYKKFLFKDCLITNYKLFWFNILDKQFGRKETPYKGTCSAVIDDESYPNQERYNSLDKKLQAMTDIYNDRNDILKHIRILKEPLNLLRYYSKTLKESSEESGNALIQEFAEIGKSYETLKEYFQVLNRKYSNFRGAQDDRFIEYYTEFRPMLLQVLEQMREKFPYKKKQNIKNLIEQRFVLLKKAAHF